MAKSVIARRQGDEFQALFFWKQLVNLLIDETLKQVTFESDQQIFVDDVVVEYYEPALDEYTGQPFRVDAYQCKYHVARNIIFSIDNLIDPDFLNNKQSMLQRLFKAYREFSEKGELFRLHVVSSSGWDTNDPFTRFVSAENHIRTAFFEGGLRSVQGKLRQKLAEHLGVSEAELGNFLHLVRFDLGMNRKDIVEALSAKLQLAGLLPLEKTITNTRYAELAWKWLEQGGNVFDKQLLTRMVLAEKLIDTSRKNLLIIRHQSLDPIAPNAVQEDLPDNLRNMASNEFAIDLTRLFRDGSLVDPQLAINHQEAMVNEIARLWNDQSNIEIAYYGIAHIPLVFRLGYQLNVRKSIYIFEHNRKNNRWDLLSSTDTYPSLIVRKSALETDIAGNDIVIKFGVSYPIMNADVNKIVPSPKLTMELALPTPALDSIRSIGQLDEYALAFRYALDAIHNMGTQVDCVHVFYAGPVSLAFRCGQLISPTIHPSVLVYNYFSKDNPKYKWGIRINSPVASPDFLVQLKGA